MADSRPEAAVSSVYGAEDAGAAAAVAAMADEDAIAEEAAALAAELSALTADDSAATAPSASMAVTDLFMGVSLSGAARRADAFTASSFCCVIKFL